MSIEFGDWLKLRMKEQGIAVGAMAKALGVNGSAISQWRSGGTLPGIERVPSLAAMLQAPVEEVLRRMQATGEPVQKQPAAKTNIRPALNVPAPENIRGFALDVPVFGIAVGGRAGDFRFNGEIAERVLRPPGLLGVDGLFAVRLTNDSMYPAWKDGALLYIHPTRRPLIGDDVIVELNPTEPGEPGEAFLKRLVARTPTLVRVEQFNPADQLEFDLADVKQLHRVIPLEELLGIS